MNEKLSQDDLLAGLHIAAEQVILGATYRHYKGNLYTVIDLGIEEATNEISVIYKALYGEQLVFIRAVTSWAEMVEVDGTILPRFAKA